MLSPLSRYAIERQRETAEQGSLGPFFPNVDVGSSSAVLLHTIVTCSLLHRSCSSLASTICERASGDKRASILASVEHAPKRGSRWPGKEAGADAVQREKSSHDCQRTTKQVFEQDHRLALIKSTHIYDIEALF